MGGAGFPVRRRPLLYRLVIAGALVIAAAVVTGTMLARGTDELASPPGAVLPSGADCAQTIDRSGWEPVPANTAANNRTPDEIDIPERTDYSPDVITQIVPRIDGAFTGTTDEIIEWAACKWGFDSDLVRAQAFVESSWVQSATGDRTHNPDECVPGDTPPCPTSFGLLQIKHLFHEGTYPASRQSTAFNIDYALGLIRACFEGGVAYLPGEYRSGDIEGCLGHHFSGRWRDDAGLAYADRVLQSRESKGWSSLPGAVNRAHVPAS